MKNFLTAVLVLGFTASCWASDPTQRLHAAVSSVCPISGVSIGKIGDPRTVKFTAKDSATKTQILNARSAINAFDWSDAAQDAWDNQKNKDAAKSSLDAPTPNAKLIRATIAALLDEINLLRVRAGMAEISAEDLDVVISGKIDASSQ